MAVRHYHRSTPGHDMTGTMLILNEAVTALNALIARVAALTALANELKADHNLTVVIANEVKADHNALLTKLDADAGVTDTNYAATLATAAANSTTTAAADVVSTAITAVDTIDTSFS